MLCILIWEVPFLCRTGWWCSKTIACNLCFFARMILVHGTECAMAVPIPGEAQLGERGRAIHNNVGKWNVSNDFNLVSLCCNWCSYFFRLIPWLQQDSSCFFFLHDSWQLEGHHRSINDHFRPSKWGASIEGWGQSHPFSWGRLLVGAQSTDFCWLTCRFSEAANVKHHPILAQCYRLSFRLEWDVDGFWWLDAVSTFAGYKRPFFLL